MKTQNNKQSFAPSSLPHTRKEQYFDIIKHRFMLLVGLSFIIFLGFLPLLFIYGLSVYFSNTDVFLKAIESYNLSNDMQSVAYFWMNNFMYLILIPLFILAFVVFSASLRIYRLLGWGEGMFLFHDLLKGLKTNFKQGIIVGSILGIYLFVSKFIGGALTLYVNGGLGIAIEIILKAILIIIFIPILVIYLFYSTYFNDKFLNSIIISFQIYVSKLFFFLALSLCTLIIYVFPYVGNYYLIIIFVLILMVFICPFYCLTWNQIILNIFDDKIENDEVKLKGLYDPKKYNNDDELD